MLQHYGIPEKIVRMIYPGLLQRLPSKSFARCDGDMVEPFSMSTGVRQGCLLSPFLFLVAPCGENNTGSQLTLLQKLKDLDFADDMVLLSQKITATCVRSLKYYKSNFPGLFSK